MAQANKKPKMEKSSSNMKGQKNTKIKKSTKKTTLNQVTENFKVSFAKPTSPGLLPFDSDEQRWKKRKQ